MNARHVALVREPASRLSEGIVTHVERRPVDVALARRQWRAYAAALESNGWPVVPVDRRDDLPDSVFVEDALVLFGELAVITRPGANTRRPEVAAVESSARGLGLRVVRIEAPGTLEGGDVLKVGMSVYVGHGGRTNAEGIRQLGEIVAPLGYDVTTVPMSRALHLKSAVTALPDGTFIGFSPVVDTPELFPGIVSTPEEQGCHVVTLAEDTVLMSSAAPRTRAMFEDRGLRTVTVDISEFEKLEGCVTCLSVRVR